MTEDMLAVENPFSTRRTRPGAVPYYFPNSLTSENLVDRLRQNHWRGEIVGPHGSGKTTLLLELVAALKRADRQPILFELHDGQRRMPADWRSAVESSPSAHKIVVVDGYEQLGAWPRFSLKRYCRHGNLGLLVTSHSSVGLPEIFKTPASPEITRQIVDQLMRNHRISISPEIIGDLFARRGGNVRDLLFDLYDLFEHQSQTTGLNECFVVYTRDDLRPE